VARRPALALAAAFLTLGLLPCMMAPASAREIGLPVSKVCRTGTTATVALAATADARRSAQYRFSPALIAALCSALSALPWCGSYLRRFGAVNRVRATPDADTPHRHKSGPCQARTLGPCGQQPTTGLSELCPARKTYLPPPAPCGTRRLLSHADPLNVRLPAVGDPRRWVLLMPCRRSAR